MLKRISFLVSMFAMSSVAFAEEVAGASTGFTDKGALYLAGILGVAIAAYGGTAAQSRAASVALEGVARNPGAADKLFTPMLLALALMESLVIFTLVSIFIVKL